ncbi:unnamed protein product, partial [Ascophyllum nodosum]
MCVPFSVEVGGRNGDVKTIASSNPVAVRPAPGVQTKRKGRPGARDNSRRRLEEALAVAIDQIDDEGRWMVRVL